MMRLQGLSLALAAGLSLRSRRLAHDHAHMMQMEAAQPLSGASLYNVASTLDGSGRQAH